MYSVSQLSKLTGLSESNLRSRVDRQNIKFITDKGIRYFPKKQAEKVCGMPLDDEFSELLFDDFLRKNPGLSREEAYDVLGIPDGYVFEKKEYVFESKLNHLSLNEL